MLLPLTTTTPATPPPSMEEKIQCRAKVSSCIVRIAQCRGLLAATSSTGAAQGHLLIHAKITSDALGDPGAACPLASSMLARCIRFHSVHRRVHNSIGPYYQACWIHALLVHAPVSHDVRHAASCVPGTKQKEDKKKDRANGCARGPVENEADEYRVPSRCSN
ncbi:hypothetical protein VTO42DRAFT_4101 [Malbranchea cinnamomea]